MSVNILGDHNLDIDISLIKKTREFDTSKGIIEERIDLVVPLDLGAILELTIEDTLLASGIRGVIKINNKFNILDSLGVATKSSDNLFINIKIADEELSSTDFEEFQKKIEFLGLIEKTSTASANIQDNVVIFEFEEAFIADLKHTTFESVVGKLKETGSVKDLIVAAYKQVVPDADPKDIIFAKKEISVNIGNNLPLTINQKKPDESIYERFSILLQNTRIATNTAGSYDDFPEKNAEAFGDVLNLGVEGLLPSFRFGNFNNGRRMILKPYLTDRHREFIEEVREDGIQSKTNETGNYSDVYTEKFTIGPFAKISGLTDPNTNWHNSLETYNITRPNIGMLREDVWANYLLIADKTQEELFNMEAADVRDPGTVNQTVITYAEVVEHFIDIELNLKGGEKDGVNLPLVDPKSQAKKILYPSGAKTENQLGRRAIVYNKLAKSFLTVNEQIQFEVKGQVYRTPGKFIWVETQESDNLLENLWYVNSIKHIIVDGKYTTEVIANRVFGGNTTAAFKQLTEDVKQLTKDVKNLDSDIDEPSINSESEIRDIEGVFPSDYNLYETSSSEQVEKKNEELEIQSAPSKINLHGPLFKGMKEELAEQNLKELQKEYEELQHKYKTDPDFTTEDNLRLGDLNRWLGIIQDRTIPFP